jgi:hypothetical protein
MAVRLSGPRPCNGQLSACAPEGLGWLPKDFAPCASSSAAKFGAIAGILLLSLSVIGSSLESDEPVTITFLDPEWLKRRHVNRGSA